MRFWTTKEVAVLREHYERGGPDACLPLLPGRSRAAVMGKARLLGLRAPKHWKGIRPYESNEFIDAQIRRVYQGTPTKGAVRELAERIGRPRAWVTRRAAHLGLVVPRLREPEWSEEEVEILEATTHLRPEAVQRRLQKAGYRRTATAIAVKRKRLGLRQERDGYSARELAVLMGVDSKTVCRWISRGMLRATRVGTERTDAQGGDVWRIRDRDVRRFVVDYTQAVDIRKVDKYWFIDLLTGESRAKAAGMREAV